MPLSSASSLDKELGMLFYASTVEGIGGRIKWRLEDFVVEELAAPGRLLDPPLGGGYTLLLVEKKGIDTFTAARRLAKALKVPLNDVSYAGLKDANAVAVQRFSIKGMIPLSLETTPLTGLKILKVQPFHKPLAKKDLYGNRFTVTVRAIPLNPGEALSKVRMVIYQLMKRKGFLNYYGYQRFGTKRPNTHIVGRYIVKGDFEAAVNEYLFHAYPEEGIIVRRARTAGDLRESLRLMPKGMVYERRMLNYLIHHPNDYVGALRVLPKALLRLIVEAYQAYLFNKTLSYRVRAMRDYHLPMEGDYVVTEDRSFKVKDTSMVEKFSSMVEEGSACVAIPLPSYELRLQPPLPPFLEKVLKEEKVSLEDFKVEEFPYASLLSRPRKIVCKPEGFTIIEVDKDELNPPLTKLTLRFILERGTYATSLLRDILKPIDPSSSGF
mgnify:CR=1 FL=1